MMWLNILLDIPSLTSEEKGLEESRAALDPAGIFASDLIASDGAENFFISQIQLAEKRCW